MAEGFNRSFSSTRLVLGTVLDTLAELGYTGLTPAEIKARAGAADPVLGDSPDTERLVIAALQHVDLIPPPEPPGHLGQDLRSLLEP